jgi:hypothetical protein
MLNLFAKNLELLDNNDMIILVPKKNMNFNYVVTSQYLLKSQINYTITLLSTPQIENISHDTINHYVRY